jgi:hypothetical protein
MAKLQANDLEQQPDSRVVATQQIWSYATGMLAIYMVFAPTKNTFIPPVFITVGAVISTAFVWKSDKKYRQAQTHQLQQIEERLANLETIAGGGELEASHKIKQLEISDLQITRSNSRQV